LPNIVRFVRSAKVVVTTIDVSPM